MTQPERQEDGSIKAKPGKTTIHEWRASYGNEPPRLMAALYDAPTEQPEDTAYLPRKNPGSNAAPAPPPSPADAPKASEAEKIAINAAKDFTDPDMIKKIMKWVYGRLVDPNVYKTLWKTQEAQIKLWAKSDTDPDELWAQKFTERFLSITYGGPGQAYFGDGGWDGYIFSRLQPTIRPVIPYQETKKDGSSSVRNGYRIDNWQVPDQWKKLPDDPAKSGTKLTLPLPKKPKDEVWVTYIDPPVKNDDPAIPIVAACQQTTSLMAVTRGFSVEDYMNGAGFAASEGSGKLTMFTGVPASSKQAVKEKGTFYTLGSKLANGKTLGDVYSDPTTANLLQLSYSLDPANLKPTLDVGTILTYNPHGFMPAAMVAATPDGQNKKQIMVHISAYEQKDPGQQMKIRATVCRELLGRWKEGDQAAMSSYTSPRTAPEADYAELEARKFVPPQRKKNESDDALKARREAAEATFNQQKKDWLADRSMHDVPLELGAGQDPGSHIAGILRIMKGDEPKKRRAQMYDTSNNSAYWVLETEGRRGLTVRPQQGGIMDGCAIPNDTRPDVTRLPCNSICTGFGVLPPPDPALFKAQLDQLEVARPVGLVRLLVSIRTRPSKQLAAFLEKAKQPVDLGPSLNYYQYNPAVGPQEGDLLYASKLLRMYGDAKTDNFYLSKLLWSLRSTPFFSNIQPWWFVFIPTGILAKSMYAEGARAMTPAEFVKTVVPSYPPVDKPDGKGKNDPFPPRDKDSPRDIRFPKHYMLSHVFTNCGSATGQNGRAVVWARYKSSLADTGSTSRGAEGYSPPKAFLKILEKLGSQEEYISSDLKKKASEIGDSSGISWFKTG